VADSEEKAGVLDAEQLQRPSIKGLDELLGKAISVLDDGFVRVIDYLGNDEAVVQAARVSYGAGTRKIHEDRGLIRYLMRHHHTSPFEMCEIKLHVRAPMDVWRQWIRHRTANVNEYSTRYSIAIDAAHRTDPGEWRLQAPENKQGSSGTLDASLGEHVSDEERELQSRARAVYEHRLQIGIAREQARKDLPLSTYTEAYWKIDLHNLLHFLRLRMDPRAQQEIRAYADAIGDKIVSIWVPTVWEAFRDYQLHAIWLSRLEIDIVRHIQARNIEAATVIATRHGLLNRRPDGSLAANRERRELEAKLRALGFEVPWT
jgi:thymidylate synthase (FAD)